MKQIFFLKDLKVAGIPIKHQQQYLHAHKCKYCDANLGRASYYCKSAQQPGGDELVLSTIVDQLSPATPITQTLANEHEVTSAAPMGTMLRPFKTVMNKGPLGKELADKMDSLEATVKQLGTIEDAEPNCSPAGTDLQIDWTDACSLGRNCARYSRFSAGQSLRRGVLRAFQGLKTEHGVFFLTKPFSSSLSLFPLDFIFNGIFSLLHGLIKGQAVKGGGLPRYVQIKPFVRRTSVCHACACGAEGIPIVGIGKSIGVTGQPQSSMPLVCLRNKPDQTTRSGSNARHSTWA